MLVVIEGVDGSGKQTQSQMLYDRLSEKFEIRRLTFPITPEKRYDSGTGKRNSSESVPVLRCYDG